MRLTRLVFSVLLILLSSQLIFGQETFEQTIKETLSFSNSDKLISVHNINGSVHIEGYSGSEAIIEAEQFVKMKRRGDIEDAISELNLKMIEDDGIVLVYVEVPHSSFNQNRRKYEFDNYNHGKRRYHYNYDITVKVPYNTNVEVSTINDGSLLVENIQASTIDANNLNGKLSLENVAGQIKANALNKDIDVVYSKNPTEESWFNALNGDVNITVPNDLDADVTFYSLNGGFYSNLDASAKRGALIKTVSNNKKRTKYKLSSKDHFIVGSGGPHLHFDLLNGDVNLMKSK